MLSHLVKSAARSPAPATMSVCGLPLASCAFASFLPQNSSRNAGRFSVDLILSHEDVSAIVATGKILNLSSQASITSKSNTGQASVLQLDETQIWLEAF